MACDSRCGICGASSCSCAEVAKRVSALANRRSPSWSVVCDDVPKTIHVRDEGHVCRSPKIVDPFPKEVP